MNVEFSNVEDFIIAAISMASPELRKTHRIGKCEVAGADPSSTIWVIEENGEPKVINITVEERKA